MNAIVPLYLLSPVLMKLVKGNLIGALTVSFALSGASPLIFFQWTPPFVIGMACAEYDFFCRIRGRSELCGAILIAIVGFYFRKNILADGFLGVAFIAVIFRLCDIRWISVPLAFLGRHSMNIFYVHMFYRSIWFGREFFSNLNPGIAFVLLLTSSLVTSVLFNRLKLALKWSLSR